MPRKLEEEVGEAGVCLSNSVWRLASLAFWWPRQLKKGTGRHQLTFCILSLRSGWVGCWDFAHVKGDFFLAWSLRFIHWPSLKNPLQTHSRQCLANSHSTEHGTSLYVTRNTEWFHENLSIYTKSRFPPQWALWVLDFVCHDFHSGTVRRSSQASEWRGS